MALDTSIVFTGLCAFVPSKAQPRRVAVILVNARHGKIVSDFREAHTPMLEFRVDDLEDNDVGLQRPAFEVFEDKRGFWFLSGDNVEVVAEGTTLGVSYTNDINTTKKEPSDFAELKWLIWIPHMEKISATAGEIKSDYISGYTPDYVAARFLLKAGTLQPKRFTEKGAFIHWEFKEQGGTSVEREQTMAESVGLYFDATKLVLNIKSFDGKNPRQLTFRRGSEVFVRNVELEQITQPYEDAYPDKAGDFALLYKLCKNTPKVNIPHNKGLPIVALSRPICPSAVFDETDQVPTSWP